VTIGDGIAVGLASLAVPAIIWAMVWNNVRLAQIKVAAFKDGILVEDE